MIAGPGRRERGGMSRVWGKRLKTEETAEMKCRKEASQPGAEGWQQKTNFPGTSSVLASQTVRRGVGLGQPRPVASSATEHRLLVSLKAPLMLVCTGSSSWCFCFLFCFWLSQETSTLGTVLGGASINPPCSSANFQIGRNGRQKMNK